MKQFDITYFYGPEADKIVKEEVIAIIAEAGITLTHLCHTTEINKAALTLMKKHGLRADVGDPRISRLYRENDLQHVDEVIRLVVNDYAEFNNVEGFDICDEPSSDNFEMLAAIVSAFKKYAPDKETVINLFPNYATPEQLSDSNYTTHLERFAKVVQPHFISYDHYHFLGRNVEPEEDHTTDTRERLIRLSAQTTVDRGGFFENIEEIRRVGLQNDLEQMLIVLLTEHGPYRNLTRAELMWEVNMCLAYGFHRISYFTYWEPPYDPFWRWTNAMSDRSGNRTQHWHDVQAINSRIHPIGKLLFDTKSSAVFHIGKPEAGAHPFEGYGKIRFIQGENAVIGFFENGLIYLVNRNYQSENTLILSANGKLTRYTENEFVPCSETITLSAGDAVLLRIDD